MFRSYIYRIAIRYFFAKDAKTIVNRINGFALFMIVAASCVLLVVLSAFAGLKDFGLSYTSSFDPDLKIYSKNDRFFKLEKDDLKFLSEIICILFILVVPSARLELALPKGQGF